MAEPLWDDNPNLQPSSGIRVLKLFHGDSKNLICLGRGNGVWVHWLDPRSIPCLGESCKVHELPIQWKGYSPVCVPVIDDSGPRERIGGNKISGRSIRYVRAVLELGADNKDHWLSFQNGQKLVVTRAKTTKEVKVQVTGLIENLDILPDVFDVRPVLLRLWGRLHKPGPTGLEGGDS